MSYGDDRERIARKEADTERATTYLMTSIQAVADKMHGNRDWNRVKRFLDRLLITHERDWGPRLGNRELLCLLPYSEYLESEHWKEKRAKARERANGRCQICNGDGELHTHHRTYERIGHERDDDLIVLCKRCHELFHTHCQLDELAD